MDDLPERYPNLRAQERRQRTASRSGLSRIDTPGPGQESVWDYPRPPRVEADSRRIRIEHGGVLVANSVRALRVLETASPPCFYLPREDVRGELLRLSDRVTMCEWKGVGSYWHLHIGDARVADAAWSYPEPWPGFDVIAGHLAFFAHKLDACWVGDERAVPQPGAYYGGWITSELVGPFKGAPGSEGW